MTSNPPIKPTGLLAKLGVGSDKVAALQARLDALEIREEDLVERFVRASGPGGQKVNKTSSAVYIKHLPSGTEVKAQGARSQALNRYQARRLLVEKLEAQIHGRLSAEAQRVAKVQRQKRKRSRRAKAKTVAAKRAHGDKKEKRRKVDPGGD